MKIKGYIEQAPDGWYAILVVEGRLKIEQRFTSEAMARSALAEWVRAEKGLQSAVSTTLRKKKEKI